MLDNILKLMLDTKVDLNLLYTDPNTGEEAEQQIVNGVLNKTGTNYHVDTKYKNSYWFTAFDVEDLLIQQHVRKSPVICVNIQKNK